MIGTRVSSSWPNLVEEFHAPFSRLGVRLDHPEDLPGGIVLDGEDPLLPAVVEPVHVDADQ